MVEKDPASKFSLSDHEREADASNKPALQSGSDFGPPAIEGINLCDPQDVLTPRQLQELHDALAALKIQRRMDAASAYASNELID